MPFISITKDLSGVVHHAHMNGIEVAVKFPKIKLTLRGKDLKKFGKEVALQAKVRYALSFQSANCYTLFASQFRDL
jgi:serine/threonine protein kinase